MHSQEFIKVLAAVAAAACVAFGILALFRGLRADGEVDVSALFRGKVKTGSAGVLLLFFGVALFGIVVMKGYQSQTQEQTRRNPAGVVVVSPNGSPSPSDPAVEEKLKIKIETIANKTEDDKKHWWEFWK
jgi:hypothetical protein